MPSPTTAGQIERMEPQKCSCCERLADPDTELLVIVLGVPLCSACSEERDDA